MLRAVSGDVQPRCELSPAGLARFSYHVEDFFTAVERHVIEAEHGGHLFRVQAELAVLDAADLALRDTQPGADLAGRQAPRSGVEGEVPLVITIHRPSVTLRCGDGPEVRLTPRQVNALCCQLDDAEAYFLEEPPETIG